MEETYWNKFMASGKVDDYLEYKGIQIIGCRDRGKAK